MKTSRIFLWAILLIPFISYAQLEREVPVLLNTPQNTVEVHLHYLQAENYQPTDAGKTILGAEDSIQASKLAIQLIQLAIRI